MMFVQGGRAHRFYACANLTCTREWLIEPGDTYVRRVYPSGIVTYRHTDGCEHANLAAVAVLVEAATEKYWATQCAPSEGTGHATVEL